ncbi:PLATZ transcription factor, partial [Dillenia turbinata]
VGVSIPRWFEPFFEEKFYEPCLIHETSKKNEKNIFCLDCCTSFCPQCVPFHRSHKLLQIRRYMYHDVLKVSDAQKLADCSLVQSYTANSAKVIYIRQRPQNRPFKNGNNCITCSRNLQDPFFFCSLFCKIQNLITSEGSALKEVSNFRIPAIYGLDSFVSIRSSSGSIFDGEAVSCRAIACTATTEFAKKKRTTISVPRSFFPPTCSPAAEVAVAMNKRKGVPQRSPLY